MYGHEDATLFVYKTPLRVGARDTELLKKQSCGNELKLH